VKTRKPTGDAECPPEVRRAHEIDHKLQSKIACRDLEDGDIIEVEDDGGDSDDEMSDSYDPPQDGDGASPAPDQKPTPRVRTVRVEAPLLSGKFRLANLYRLYPFKIRLIGLHFPLQVSTFTLISLPFLPFI